MIERICRCHPATQQVCAERVQVCEGDVLSVIHEDAMLVCRWHS